MATIDFSKIHMQTMAMADFGKVAVVCGGHSAEREVSLNSGASVLAALQSAGINAHHFDPAKTDVTELKNYDRVFNVLHGRGGEDGQLQGLLSWLNIPNTGSGVLGSAIGMDKVRTKQLWLGCDLPTMPYEILTKNTDWQAVVARLGLPLIIKPVHEGSSIGMSKVTSLEALPAAFAKASEHDAVVMAEKWITGKEYTVVIIAGKAYPVIRLEPAAGMTFYDYEAKYERNDTSYGIPSGLSATDEAQLKTDALKAFDAVGASGWGRIDAMQDEQGNMWLLEVNTVPGMTDHSLVPMAAQAEGIDFVHLCVMILGQTL